MAQIKITWKKSCIGHPGFQRRIIRSLGLHRLNHTVIHADTPTIRGMVLRPCPHGAMTLHFRRYVPILGTR